VAEEGSFAGERVGENRPVYAAVEDGENGIPVRIGDEALERREHPLEQVADRLAPEEPLVERDRPPEGAHELRLELVWRNVGEGPASELAQIRPVLDLCGRCDDARGLSRAWKAACQDTVECDLREELARRLGLREAVLVQLNLVLTGGSACRVEVGDSSVPHEIEPSSHGAAYDRTMSSGDIVETIAAVDSPAKPPLLVLDRVREFLDAHELGSGDVRARRIGEGGGSNFTFLLERDEGRFVLRRPPRPPLPPSAHDVVREARLQLALREAGFTRLPTIVAVGEDESVLGVPFYVMTYLDGHVPTDELPPGLESEQARRHLGDDLVDSLVEIHNADVTTSALAAFARPGSYNERQVRRFAQLWDINKTREIRRVEQVGAWLADNLPAPLPETVVHGDFRLGNAMVASGKASRILAVLDWEMGAIGDPRADVGYLLATYSEPGGPANPLGTSPVTALPGFPSRAQLGERYVARSGRDVEPLAWFEALALWKAAVFCEAIYGRFVRGELGSEDERAARFEQGVPYLAEAAAAAIARA
jgi:aminoglycoside phosphotransferase (APT) family kinase protein